MTPLDPLDKWGIIMFVLSPFMGWVWNRFIRKKE